MFIRDHRLRRRADIERVYRHGQQVRSQNFALRYRANQLTHPRVVVIVGKKVSKKALVRNRIRRRLAAELGRQQLAPGYDVLVNVYNDVSGQAAETIKNELTQALHKAHLNLPVIKE